MHPELQTLFTLHSLDAFLISDIYTVRYFSGFTGTNGLILVTPTQGWFFTDFRYREQAAKQVTNFTIVESSRDIGETIIEFVKKHSLTTLGCETGTLTHNQFLRLKNTLGAIKLVPITGASATLRIKKSEAEIKHLSKACEINKRAFREIKTKIKPGMSEREVKTMLEMALLKNGADKIGFDTIVASGWRGALPHGVASTKKIKSGELVTIDFGCVVDGYNSDETITIAVGKLNAKQRMIHRVVSEAQQRAIQAAKPGAKCANIDAAAREYITANGYGEYFGHALGHGVGLEVHEYPVLSPHSKDVLAEGMVFTIEPGIYIPKFGGVRVEDVFVCTKNGVKKLTKLPKSL